MKEIGQWKSGSSRTKIHWAELRRRTRAGVIRRAILDHGWARIVAATAASQKEFLGYLTSAPGIDWQLVELFHLDEYIGLPITHPASFRKMLLEQLISKTGIVKYHLLDGDDDV